MSDKKLPCSVAQSSFTIFGVEIKCHILSDGQRIIEPESMAELLKAERNPEDIESTTTSMMAFTRWMRGVE